MTLLSRPSPLRSVLKKTLWLLVVAAVPFYLFPSPTRWEGLLFLPFAALLGWLVVGWSLPRTPLNPAVLLIAVMGLVSAWVTLDLAISLPALARLVLGVALFFTLAGYGKNRKGFWVGLGLFCLVGAGMALVGLFGMSWPVGAADSKIPLLYTFLPKGSALVKEMFGEVEGFNPNIVSGALLWVLPAAFGLGLALLKATALALRLNGMRRFWHAARGVLGALGVGVCCALMMVIVVLAQSRSAYVGLAVVIGLGLLAVLPMRLRLYASAFVLGGAIALTIIALPFLPALMPIFTTAPADGPSLVFSTTSLLQRYTFWVYGLATLRDFPLTGVGLDTFRYAIFLLFNLPCSAEVCDISHVHNEFLQVGLGLGVPGLVGFGSLYLGAFWMLFRLYTRRGVLEGFPLKLMALGLGGGLLAHCIFGLTDAVLLAAKPDILFWMLLGLVAGLYQQFDNESEFIKGSEQEKTG